MEIGTGQVTLESGWLYEYKQKNFDCKINNIHGDNNCRAVLLLQTCGIGNLHFNKKHFGNNA